MRIGRLDRKITVQREQRGEANQFNESVPAWVDQYKDIWAGVRPVAGKEAVEADAMTATDILIFRTRYMPILPSDLIVYEGRNYNITNVREIGRRVGLDITAHNKDNQ